MRVRKSRRGRSGHAVSPVMAGSQVERWRYRRDRDVPRASMSTDGCEGSSNPVLPTCNSGDPGTDGTRKVVAPAFPLVEVRCPTHLRRGNASCREDRTSAGIMVCSFDMPSISECRRRKRVMIERAGQTSGVSTRGGSLPDSPPSWKRIERIWTDLLAGHRDSDPAMPGGPGIAPLVTTSQ